MANFKTHVVVAGVVGAGTAYVMITSGVINFSTGIEITFLTMLGGLLPDVDTGNSRINRMVFVWLICLLEGIYLITELHTLSTKTAYGAAIIAGGIVLARVGFNNFTVHRGIYHSIPVAIASACLIGLILHDNFVAINLSYSILAIFMGFIIHLLLDELYSINIAGMRLKKSFGTALKFRSSELIPTVLAYMVALISLIMVYVQL
mgnify:CR=1 FL=1